MPLDARNIKPLKGTMYCFLWENASVGLPLKLYYHIDIPLEPFDTGHEGVAKPEPTGLDIGFIKWQTANKPQEGNWRNLVGNEYKLSSLMPVETGAGSIWLGYEHCPFDSVIRFQSLSGTTFHIAIELDIDFNVEVVNLPASGQITLSAQLEFEGFKLFEGNTLPTVAAAGDPLQLAGTFLDTSVYEPYLSTITGRSPANWRLLKPKVSLW